MERKFIMITIVEGALSVGALLSIGYITGYTTARQPLRKFAKQLIVIRDELLNTITKESDEEA